jgi:hypothetical protein
MTPEGKVKAKVKVVLDKLEPYVYGHWIVQNGMGTPTLDYIGCCCGLYFTVETKAEGKKLTPRQRITAESTVKAAGRVFEIVGLNDFSLLELEAWLHHTVLLYKRNKATYVR